MVSYRIRWVAGFEVKDFAQLAGERAVVGIRGHDVAHEVPPAAADIRLRNRLPAHFVLDLDVGEEIARRLIEEDRITAHTMSEERLFELTPYGAVPPGIFGFLAGIDGHAEGFADHSGHSRV